MSLSRFIIIIILFVFPADMLAQNYYSFLDTNNTWIIKETFLDGQNTAFYFSYSYQGKLILDGVGYHNFGIILREDTVERRVYKRAQGFPNNECLLFDFLAPPGEIYYSCNQWVEIESISTVTILTGENRKIIYFNEDNYYIEGIGSNFGFYMGEPSPQIITELVCLKNDTAHLYGNCININVSEIKKGSVINVFPNPFENKIRFRGHEIEWFHVSDLYGRNLLKFNYSGSEIDLSELQKGIYFIAFFDTQSRLIDRKKIIKQ
jgi:hypothetical protein